MVQRGGDKKEGDGCSVYCPSTSCVMKKNIKNLIKELEYAKKLHDKDVNSLEISKSERVRNEKVSLQKELIIKALKKEISAKSEYINLLKEWRRGHWKWIEYFAHYYQKPKLNKKKEQELIEDEKENGSVNWHLRWIANYWWAIYYLEEIMKDSKSNKEGL